MITPLHQISLPTICVCAAIVLVALILIQRWALQRLNSEPADDVDNATGDKDAEILGDVPVRSKVGTPRPRRLQPPSAAEEAALSPAGGGLMPADSRALAGASASPFTSQMDKPADKPRETVALPPLSVGLAASPTGGLTKEVTPGAKPVEARATPPLSVPTVEKVADGLVAIGQPVPLTARLSGPQTPTSETDDDVKKRKSSPASAGSKPEAAPGLVIVPKAGKVEAETVKAADTPAAPKTEGPAAPAAPPPAAPPSEPKPEPAAKITGRPRIFLPANLPAPASAHKPAEEPVPVGKTEDKAESKVEVPAIAAALAAEAKPEAKTDLKPEAKPEEKPAEVPAPVAEPVPVKSETPATPAAPAEPAKPEVPIGGGWLRGLLRRADSEEPARTPTSEPVAAKAEETPVPVPTPAAEPRLSVPAAEKLPEIPAAPKTPAEPVPVPALVAETKPAPAVPVPAIKPGPALEPSPVAKTPAVPVSPSQSIMAQNENTTALPADARASAQLTLGFEVASLQLTPFFKLGGVQLKPLSKIAGLHLIASQSADAPLAAGISFEIEKVEVNEASHIKSILLKPLGESQDAAVPQSNIKVDTIQIGQGGTDGAPISVTSSGANVQLLATFAIAAMEFTPAFEIGSLRLEPTSNSVLLRLSATSKPASLDLPPAFEVANVQLGEDSQITLMRLTPGGSKPA